VKAPLVVTSLKGEANWKYSAANIVEHSFTVRMLSFAPIDVSQVADMDKTRIQLACELAAAREIALIQSERHT
jgi:hypothetical protein